MTTLGNIRAKIRKVTARPSADQITDAEIDAYINTYYVLDLPETLRLLDLKDNYNFTTVPNVDTYNFPRNDYLSVNPPAYIAGYQMVWMQDQETFFRVWPKLQSRIVVSSGNGTAGPYVFTMAPNPILRSYVDPTVPGNNISNILISASTGSSTTVIAQDNGSGGFLAPSVGTIDYISGAVTVTFSAPVPAGAQIIAQITPYASSRPTTCLFFKDKFIMRPVPDIAYQVTVECYRTPSALLAVNSTPELNEWWQLLAYGAALKIFTDNADFDQYANFRPIYEEQLLLCQRRTLKQYQNQRAATIYSQPGPVPYPNYWPYA